MRKILSLFIAALFAGSMLAQETPKLTLDFTSGGAQGPGLNAWKLPIDYVKNAEGTYTKDGKTIVISASSAGHKALFDVRKENNVPTSDTTWTGIIFGKKNTTLTLPAVDFMVSKILVYYVGNGSASTEHNIFVGDDAVSDPVTGCKVTAEGDSSVFNIASNKQAAGTVYKLKVISDHNMQVSKVEFYERPAGTPDAPVFSLASGIYTTPQSLTLTCPTEGAKIYYTLDGTNPTEASTEYTAAINVDKTMTVKAVAIKNSLSSSIISVSYKVISLEGEGTFEKPYTVSDVKALENSRPDTAWVFGYILFSLDNGKKPAEPVPSSLALGDSATQTEGFVPVELPSSPKAVREALNVKDNPDNVGKWVKVRGALVAYFTLPGVKGVKKWELEHELSTDATIKELKINNAVVAENEGVFAYAVEAGENLAEVSVSFVLNESHAKADKESPFKLAVPASSEAAASEATINVTAEDGTTKKAYTVRVTRAAAEQGIEDVLDANQAVKFIENGQIVILKNGVRYNVLGTQIR